jgi:hypothetical protein
MLDFAAQCEKARDDGAATGCKESTTLDLCPYKEEQDPVLRALWQDAFVTARHYGSM